jgi:alpha-acetolactate decarboxylase
MYYWTPKRIKELKEKGYRLHFVRNDLTNTKKCDKENTNEKIQNKNSRTRNRGSSDNTI